ncbi:MAG: SPOR domain-containing protein, partial [Rhodobacterales bacterium]
MAQQSPNPQGPAELPPESFADVQYVDSTGCVFLRAGLNGKVMWIPRVTKDGRPLCGYAPSLAASAPAAAQAVDAGIALTAPAPAAGAEAAREGAYPHRGLPSFVTRGIHMTL